ncbi:hypothetical protein CRG98_011676 [Punica granatum]|uniref:Uncharacterized protein n=1 Tax=Punica granatum TaxID=22663 RepID=A0A2I0KIE1_PUNGR|nr:hypothetical protein CRG98_011676 [Punica granatum]
MDSSSHAISFAVFLKDFQLCIFSFPSLPEIVAFACTPSACSEFWCLTAAVVSPSRLLPPHHRLSCSSNGNPRFSPIQGSPPPRKAPMASLSRCSCGCPSLQATRL